MPRLTFVLLAVLLGACGERAASPVPSLPADAGPPPADASADAAAEDAAPPDAAAAPDAEAVPDATALDADAPEAGPVDGGVPADGGATIGQRCFSGISNGGQGGPNYDQYAPVVGSHCFGTDHQQIDGIEKVVFLGDSITQGTPPTPLSQRYRFVLGDLLEARFGTGLEIENCSAWGARTDDLLEPPHQQIHECFPGPESKRTLVIMTIGGNDIAAVTKRGAEGAPLAETQAMVEDFVLKMRQAVEWFRSDPARFPNGVFVIFGNLYEFTDGTGDVTSCPAAGLAGFDQPWPDAEPLVLWAQEQYMRIAVDTQTDLIFLLEHFCGHGFKHDDPTNRCYRGPNTERWFDLTCIHPNPTGHAQIADMFMAVVNE